MIEPGRLYLKSGDGRERAIIATARRDDGAGADRLNDTTIARVHIYVPVNNAIV